MRRVMLIGLGVLELAVAVAAGCLAWQLPGAGDVTEGFGRAERATRQTSEQVRLLQNQVRELRRPEWQQMARQLEERTKTVSATLRAQKLDFDEARTVSRALGQVAGGLEGFSQGLDPEGLRKVGEGMGAAATFVEERVLPGASGAADQLERDSKLLGEDARRLSAVMRATTPDLKATRDIHEGLGRFGVGLERMQKLMQPARLEAMKEGFAGLEDSLNTGADRVSKLGGYYYPVVTMRGLRPEVGQQKFWPEGEAVAEGLRKAAAGAKAAREEVLEIEEALPPLRTSLEESRKMVQQTRQALGTALAQQRELEKLLKDGPEHAARLAEELPKLGLDLARVLRETEKLKQMAGALRQAQKGIDELTARWPELRDGLRQSAVVLRTTQKQLEQALAHRDELEAMFRDTVVLADTFATVLPGFLASLEGHLKEQEQGLQALGGSIDQAAELVPVYANSAARLATTARWLAALVALLVAGHGVHLLLNAARRQSGS